MNAGLTHIHDILISLRDEIKKEIIGQDALIEKLLITIFAEGHALLEGVPGLGKTKTIRTLSSVLGLITKRISFTPDLLPSDLTGNEIYRMKEGKFEVRKGPIFTQILLADEINRTPPKVQSALLEAMEEKRVTIGEITFDLPSPFVVFATQNPLEHEGTYPLPEAELDRFLLKITLDYPSFEDEIHIFKEQVSGEHKKIKENTLIIGKDDIPEMANYITENIHIDDVVFDYVSRIIRDLRLLTSPSIEGENTGILSYGPSTRAGISLLKGARVKALFEGRDYVLADDIKFLAIDVLAHRIGLTYRALSEGFTVHAIIKKVLENVRVP